MKDIALDELILRKYEIPSKENERELVRKFCLSLGLLQEGDSRDIIVDILFVLLKARKEKKFMESEEIAREVEKLRKTFNLEAKGISESNIRRQLKRLRDIMIVDKIKNGYCIKEFDCLFNTTSRLFEIKLTQISERIKEYAKVIDEIIK